MVEHHYLKSVEPLSQLLSELYLRQKESFCSIIQAPINTHIKSIMSLEIDEITVFYFSERNQHQIDQYYCAFYAGVLSKETLATITVDTIADYVKEQKIPTLCLSGLIKLATVCIPKPWGQEIWYTGIEQRGVSSVLGANGNRIPLPWLLQFAAPWFALKSDNEAPVLLKILDPHPEPVYGDLYFELHEKKQEVYVVTSIDKQAWPDGVGAIRLGFDSVKVDQASSPQLFKQQFLTAVQEYEAIRRRIDTFIDTLRLRDDIALQQPVDIETQKKWDSEVPEQWKAHERQKRQVMNEFSILVPLKVGDVVKVPCYVPHALQHGVRVVEFQTPVYERCIVSFAQKVLTQQHWDTDYAVNAMILHTPEQQAFIKESPAKGVLQEEIVAFDDFVVERISIEPQSQWVRPIKHTYQLVMVVEGDILCDGTLLSKEESGLLLAKKAVCIENMSSKKGTFLLARPINR